jgi:hypothetical protein
MEGTPRLQRSDRPAILETLNALLDEIDKLRGPGDFNRAARHLGLLHRKTLDFANDAEKLLFYDYLNYSYRPHGFTAVEFYRRIRGGRLDTFSRQVLERMAASLYTFYTIEAIVEDGVLAIKDLLTKTSTVLLDITLSRMARPGMSVAGHLLVFDDFTMPTGVGVPLDRELYRFDPAAARIVTRLDETLQSRTDPLLRSRLARTIIAATIKERRIAGST